MKKGYLSLVFAVSILLFAFLEVPQVNNYLAIAILSISFFLFNQCGQKKFIKELTDNLTVAETIENIKVYYVNKQIMGNHNVAMVEGKENYIFAEEEVVKSLTEAEKEAIFQHELGHLQGISASRVVQLEFLAVAMSAMGVYIGLYDSGKWFIGMIGILFALYVNQEKRSREYRADKYAIQMGCVKEDLISALCKIDKMNCKTKIDMDLSHPKLRKRINKIERL